jgi:hypothetical protein
LLLKSKLLVFLVVGFKTLTSHPGKNLVEIAKFLGYLVRKSQCAKNGSNSEKHQQLESKRMVMGELQKLHKLSSLILWKEFCCLL